MRGGLATEQDIENRYYNRNERDDQKQRKRKYAWLQQKPYQCVDKRSVCVGHYGTTPDDSSRSSRPSVSSSRNYTIEPHSLDGGSKRLMHGTGQAGAGRLPPRPVR